MNATHPFFLRLNKRPSVLNLELTERLPYFIHPPCCVQVTWSIETQDQVHYLNLDLIGDLTVDCQRCGHAFATHVSHRNRIVLCKNTQQLETLSGEQDALLIEELPTNLEDIIIDELHLYLHARHPEGTCEL